MPLIPFEGGEGTGKSTQARRCADALERLGKEVFYAREPGGTPLGDLIRRTLFAAQRVPPLSDLFLFLAARAALLEQRVRPALEVGHFVVLDRHSLSTIAYQSAGQGLPEDRVRETIDFATAGLTPDLYFVFTIDPEVGLQRTAKRKRVRDRLDREDEAFHRRVYARYAKFGEEISNSVVIDTTQGTEEEIHAQVMTHLRNKFPTEF